MDERTVRGLTPNDFAWNGFNTGALLDWLNGHDIVEVNGWLAMLSKRGKCFLHREPNGTITIEEPF